MAKTKLSGRAGKLKKEGKKLFIVCLSVRARKFKRKAKSCLLFVYLAGLGSLKERLKVVYCLFIQQGGKFKTKAKRCLLFVYPTALGSLKERLKVVYCLFIQQGGKFKRKAKSCLLFVYPAGLGG